MQATYFFFIFLEILIFLLAFLASFWPLVVCAIALAVWKGNWLLALCFAAVADLLYGPPTSIVLHVIPVPFTLITLLCVVVWALLMRHMRHDMPDVL